MKFVVKLSKIKYKKLPTCTKKKHDTIKNKNKIL